MVAMVVLVDVALAELIENGSGPLGVDCRNLGHYLAIVGVGTVVELRALTVAGLCGADLGWTRALVAIIVTLASSGPVGCPVVAVAEVGGAHLLIIVDSILLEDVVESNDSVSVTGVESVSSELLKLAIGHLLSLLQLLRIELHLSWVHSLRASVADLLLLVVSGLHITVVVISVVLLSLLTGPSSSILLSNSAL